MKIIILGCPGAGKSVLTRRINEFLNYPVLHLDRIYHTGGKSHITREELTARVREFAGGHDRWIIDGNYISTVAMRAQLADTIVVMNIPAEICLENVRRRARDAAGGAPRSDMAEGFDETLTDDFMDFIAGFGRDTLPRIREILDGLPGRDVVWIDSYEQCERWIDSLRQRHGVC